MAGGRSHIQLEIERRRGLALDGERERRRVNQTLWPQHFTACIECGGDNPHCGLCVGTGKVTNATARGLGDLRNGRSF